jgi:hypothetical protein
MRSFPWGSGEGGDGVDLACVLSNKLHECECVAFDCDGFSAASPIPAFPRVRGKELDRDAFHFLFNRSINTSLADEA